MRRGLTAVVAATAIVALTGCQSGTAATGSSSDAPSSRTSGTASGSGSASSPPSDTTPEGTTASYPLARSDPKPDSYYPQHGVPYLDTLHYQLDLDWQPTSKRLSGTATIDFRVTTDRQSVRFELGSPMRVSKVVLDGKTVPASRSGNSVIVNSGAIKANSKHEVAITYAGRPALIQEPAERSDVQKDGFHIGKNGQVWAFQEPFGAFTWYPTSDQPADKAYYDARLTAHDGQQGVFNGQVTSTTVTGKDTTTAFHLDKPAASYLTTIAFGKYKHEVVQGPHNLPINYWYANPNAPTLKLARKTPQYLAWIEKLLGPYPFASAGYLLVPGNSGMETQTLPTFSEALSKPTLAESEGDIVHELVHQWFGDEITPSDWKDMWLNESLTMYVEFRYMEAAKMPMDWGTYAEMQAVLDQRMRDTQGPPGAYRKGDFGDLNVYLSGALLLHNLETAYGRTKFDVALRGWPATAKYGNSDRTKFAAYMSKSLGPKAGPYITNWLTAQKTPAPLSKQP
ncbi:M1 family aminopeptidase [Flexivirga alba]|uniref:Aminopeptidase N n=1 Tax=Flexivirga alba TaxID=702742 RepID=A0ABW2AC90_9MICO